MVELIAEIGINHNGDLDLAKQMVEKAANAGFDSVKFQKRDINKVYSIEELEKPRESPWGSTTRQQKEGLEFSVPQMVHLLQKSVNLGLMFGVSCWDTQSLEGMENGLQMFEIHKHSFFYKIASPLVTDHDFLRQTAATGRRVILSTGMSTLQQIDEAVEILGSTCDTILSCTSTYPTADHEVNLKVIEQFKLRYKNHKIGFSNHVPNPLASFGAIAIGAECVETHVTLDRTMYGSDQASSIEDWPNFVKGCRRMEEMRGDGVKRVYDSEIPAMTKLRKV